MEILEDKIIAKYLFEKYCSNPTNWNFVISRSTSNDGFFDASVSNNDEVWQLKIDSIYKPLPLVIGTKVDVDSATIQRNINTNTVPFGFRKLDVPVIIDVLKKLTEEGQQQMNIDTGTEFNNYLYSRIGSLQPVKPVEGESYAYGPFVFTERNPVKHNEHQKQISERLAFKMRSNLRNKYSGYG
jgi:hypothetical protein